MIHTEKPHSPNPTLGGLKCIGILRNGTLKRNAKFMEFEFCTGSPNKSIPCATLLIRHETLRASKEILESSVVEAILNPCELIVPGRLELYPQIITKIWETYWN